MVSFCLTKFHWTFLTFCQYYSRTQWLVSHIILFLTQQRTKTMRWTNSIRLNCVASFVCKLLCTVGSIVDSVCLQFFCKLLFDFSLVFIVTIMKWRALRFSTCHFIYTLVLDGLNTLPTVCWVTHWPSALTVIFVSFLFVASTKSKHYLCVFTSSWAFLSV